ncbi:MAG: hypothetical protein OXN17_07965 [Candidatus Poribacteria bacterium]|nr:hypothetical protein [Candidatus Poribacteria bacterium]
MCRSIGVLLYSVLIPHWRGWWSGVTTRPDDYTGLGRRITGGSDSEQPCMPLFYNGDASIASIASGIVGEETSLISDSRDLEKIPIVLVIHSVDLLQE